MKKEFIFLIIASICFFCSCRNANSITPECESCNKKVPDFKNELKIHNSIINFYFWQGAGKNILDDSYALGIPEYELSSQNNNLLSEFQMGSILGYYHVIRSQEVSDHSIVTCVLYADITKDDSIVTMDNVIGAAIYFIQDEKLKVNIFEKRPDKLIDIKAYNSEVNGMPVLDFYKIGLILKKNSTNVSALLLTTKTYSNKEFKEVIQNSDNSLTHKLEVYLNNNKLFKLQGQNKLTSVGFQGLIVHLQIRDVKDITSARKKKCT